MVLRILAGGFSQRGRVGRHVQDVVHHLERQADGRAVCRQRRCLRLRWTATCRTHHHAALQQRPGLELVHVAQLLFAQGTAHAGQVDRLPAGHAGAAGGTRQKTAQGSLHVGRDGFVLGCQQLESERLQGIAGQQGCGFAKLHVYGGFATAQHIVVHTRHVVVHQGIGVNEFGGAGRAHGRVGIAVDRLTGRQHQQRAQAFATVQYRVTHGPHQLGRSTMVQPGGRFGRYPALQRTFHVVQALDGPGAQVEGAGEGHSGVHALRVPASSTLIWFSTASSLSRQYWSNSAPRR